MKTHINYICLAVLVSAQFAFSASPPSIDNSEVLQRAIMDAIASAKDGDHEGFANKVNNLKNSTSDLRPELCRQLLIFMCTKHEDLPQHIGWSVISIYNSMGFTLDDKTAACLPLLTEGVLTLDGPGNEHLGRSILREIEMPHGMKGSIDFSPYERFMTSENDKPAWLINHMYDSDPLLAIISFAKMDLPSDEVGAFVQKINASPVELATLEELGERPEWWAHLYVATVLDKDSLLRTPGLIEILEKDTNPVVQSKVSKLIEEMAPKPGVLPAIE